MVWCKKCKLINIKITNLNFASLKSEGQPSAKYTHNKLDFFCNNCESKWQSIPEAEETYFEYADLKTRTQLQAFDAKNYKNKKFSIQTIVPSQLIRRKELAKKIITSYKHLLDLDRGEWREIEQDAG